MEKENRVILEAVSLDKKALAKKWRKETGRSGKDGYVIIFKGKVAGWMDKLRNPEHWQAGCVAVAENGGNYNSGAESWQPSEAK